ncbi:RteC domain-containing protein [Flavobacterium soli]|uniref:RteC domain-containing protein n=1 Tax=Flavobacterium soli TaxID=344881 RepID=UPI000A0496CD|nr:RteC domain-containing protein [Flavobacterium soli]
MKDYSIALAEQLERQLAALVPSPEEDLPRHCEQAIRLCLDALGQLRTAFLKQEPSQAEEIEFFRHGKPLLSGRLLYFQELYRLEDHRPLGSEKTVRHYYRQALRKKERFFERHAAFHRYCRRGDTYLDGRFFLRRQECTADGESFHFQLDPLFATSHDYKVAQFAAYARLQDYLAGKLEGKAQASHVVPQLQWTGPKVGLIELAYALHTEGVFRHGATDIGEIVAFLGRAFGVEVGQFHRTFHEICNRKTDRTKFLMALQEHLLRRMEEADAT